MPIYSFSGRELADILNNTLTDQSFKNVVCSNICEKRDPKKDLRKKRCICCFHIPLNVGTIEPEEHLFSSLSAELQLKNVI